jgi:hypothetical protein
MGNNIFFWGKFSPLGDQKKSNVTCTKGFCEENVPKSLDFEENICKIAMHIIGSTRSPKYSKILKKFHFFL